MNQGDARNEPRLLIVDDDQIFGDVLAAAMRRRGFTVELAGSLADACKIVGQRPPAYAIVDLRIGNDSGLELVRVLANTEANTRTVVLTGFGSIATAVDAIKLGAAQYLTKPADVSEILAALTGDMGGELPAPPERPLSIKRLEWEHIQKVLAENGGNISATARDLGMHRRTLQRKLQKRPVRE